jgi:hypothetical protein
VVGIVNAKKFQAYPRLRVRVTIDACEGCGGDIVYYESDSPWGSSRDSEWRRMCPQCRRKESEATTAWWFAPVGASKAFHKRRHTEPL